MRLALILIALAIIAVGVQAFLRRGTPAANMNTRMAQLADEAKRLAERDYHAILDYSPQSIQRLDEILEAVHQRHLVQRIPHEQLIREANVWGAYIGEAARKIKGGSWHRDSKVAGNDASPLVHVGGDEVFPLAWVYRRITNGPEDNVWIKFQITYMPQNLKRLDLH